MVSGKAEKRKNGFLLNGGPRGQLSIEFFLVLSLIIAFSIVLYNISRTEVSKTKAVSSIVLTKNSLDSLSQSVDFVALSGNGSSVNLTAFIPKEANCFYYNETRDAFFCVFFSPVLQDEGNTKQFVYGPVFSTRLSKNFTSSCSPPLGSGWWNVQAVSYGDSVNVSCSAR